jgi:hypothetical protein
MDINYDDFDWNFYININTDLSHIKTKKEAINHFIKQGKNENRIYKEDKNINIDIEFYKFIYDDLSNINNNSELIKHYYLNGKNEDRIINKNDIRYKLFHWKYYLEFNNDIVLNKLINKKYSLKDYLFRHYVSNGIKENRPVYNFNDFDWIFYKNIYKLNINNELDSKIHYIENDDNIFINNNIYNNYKLFDEQKYIKYYNLENTINKKSVYQHYLQNYKKGNIYFQNLKSNLEIKSKIGIAISIYISKDTPEERLLCSKICINSILKECTDMYIIFVIDNCITLEYLNFLFDVIDNRNNVKVYVNKKNYGIAKTKNICIKLLEELDIEYLCLLDDDVEIKLNFNNYIEHIFNEINDIPLLTNYNFELPHNKVQYNNIELIKTSNYFGNFLCFNKKFINNYGYMRIFNYKWGHEHIDITHRYLDNTKFKNTAIDLSNYINNFQIINLKNTLHLHSCYVDHKKVESNKNILDKYNNNFNYVNFILDKTEFYQITILELNKINFINKKFNKYNKYIQNYLKNNEYLEGSYWNKLDSYMEVLYYKINKDYNKYNSFNVINSFIDKINSYNISDDIKDKIMEDIKNINFELNKTEKYIIDSDNIIINPIIVEEEIVEVEQHEESNPIIIVEEQIVEVEQHEESNPIIIVEEEIVEIEQHEEIKHPEESNPIIIIEEEIVEVEKPKETNPIIIVEEEIVEVEQSEKSNPIIIE